MGTGPKKWTEALIARRTKEGRGQGDGDNYRPWLYVQEFSSKGTQTRVSPGKLSRTIHTFSYIEAALFYWEEFQTNFHGYKEQYPMARSVTLGAANALGIRHPVYRGTGVPVVMTLDAISTRIGPNHRPIDVAWDVKPFSELSNLRVQEKLSLHKVFCSKRNMLHRVFTEKSVPKNVTRNIQWARGAREVEGEIAVVPGLFTEYLAAMLHDLGSRRQGKSIRHYCSDFDKAHAFPPGSALRIFRDLLWLRLVNVNLNVREIELQPVPLPARTPVAMAMAMAMRRVA